MSNNQPIESHLLPRAKTVKEFRDYFNRIDSEYDDTPVTSVSKGPIFDFLLVDNEARECRIYGMDPESKKPNMD